MGKQSTFQESITKSKSLVKKIIYIFTVAVTAIFTFFVVFQMQIMIYFVVFPGPGPFEAVEQGIARVHGPIISKDDHYLIIENKKCNVTDCKMLGKEIRLKKEAFDIFEAGEDVTVYLTGFERSSEWFRSSVEPNVRYQNIYFHNRIGFGNYTNSIRDAYFFMILLISLTVAGGIAYWLLKRQSYRKIVLVFLVFVASYICLLFVGRILFVFLNV